MGDMDEVDEVVGVVAGDPIVVACLAPADLRPSVDPLSGEVFVNDAMATLSAADAAALEHALRAAETWGVRIVAIAAGGESVEASLRDALALGAEVVRMPRSCGHELPGGPRRCDGPELVADPAGLALSLAATIRSIGRPLLVVCGDRSPITGTGAVPAMLAHQLGAAQALGLVSLSFEPGGSVLAERRLDAGWRETLRLTPPAVCSVEAAGVRLRRASLEAALAAGSAAVPLAPAQVRVGSTVVRAGASRFYRPRTKVVPPPEGGTHERIVLLTGALAQREPPRVVGPLAPGEAAGELLEFLQQRSPPSTGSEPPN